jgi:hypothetical protein
MRKAGLRVLLLGAQLPEVFFRNQLTFFGFFVALLGRFAELPRGHAEILL